MKLILVAFFFIGLIAILPSETEANVIAGCWQTWSRCSTWSSALTGILWQSCPQRCQCLGWTTGSCQLRPSNCPLTSQAWACICSNVRRPGPRPWWCGF